MLQQVFGAFHLFQFYYVAVICLNKSNRLHYYFIAIPPNLSNFAFFCNSIENKKYCIDTTGRWALAWTPKGPSGGSFHFSWSSFQMFLCLVQNKCAVNSIKQTWFGKTSPVTADNGYPRKTKSLRSKELPQSPERHRDAVHEILILISDCRFTFQSGDVRVASGQLWLPSDQARALTRAQIEVRLEYLNFQTLWLLCTSWLRLVFAGFSFACVFESDDQLA